MKLCQNCQHDRVLNVSAKCDDCCSTSFHGHEYNGYVPSGLGIGGSNYIEFDLCLDCGQVQGQFPISEVDTDEAFA